MAQEYFDQLHEAVKQAESRGQRFDEKGKLLTSPKGAEGEMQVMPKTARKPGFGVEPAKSRDPDEIARVGKDYLKAMVDKYGDTEKALVAYNWGPKNADDWLASGADKSKLPKETQGYITRVFNNLNTTKTPAKPPTSTTEPTPAEKIMTGMTGMSAKADIKSLAQEAGPGYKAAMAMMFLADDKPDDDKTDVWKEAQPEAPDLMAPSALADLSLEYKSPFPEKKPVRMADGGEAKKMLDDLPNFEDTSGMPFEMIKGGNKMNVEDKQIEDMMLGLGTSSSMLGLNLSKMKQGEKENLAQNLMAAYRTKVGDTDVSVMGMRPTGAPPGTYMGGVSAAVPVYGNDRVILGATGMQSPYQSGMTGVNLGYSGNVGPGRLDAMMMQPVNSSQGRSYQVQYRLPVGRAEGSPMGGENADHLTPQEIERMAAAQGPAFLTPSSGRGRQAGNISKALASGEAYPAMAKGALDLPYDVVGAPVDLTTMAMRPFGYDVKKPVMGSEWIKEGLTERGIRPETPTDPTLKGFHTLGELGAGFVAPLKVIEGAQALGSKARTAAQDLKAMLQQPSRPAPAPAAQAAPVAPPVQPIANNNPPGWDVVNTGNSRFDAINARAAAEAQMPAVAPVAPPVEIPVPTVDPTRPFVGRLDAFVDQLKGPVPLGQFINQLKGKFREYDIARVEEAFKGVDPTTKLTPKQIAEGLANTYSPSRWLSETVAPGVRKDMAPTQDTVWGTSKPFGTTNLFLEQPPERLELSEKIRDGVKSLEKFKTSFDDTTLANPSGFSLQDIDKAKSFLTQEPVINAIGKEKVDALTAKLDYVSNSVASIEKTGKEVYNLTSGFMYPALYQRNGVRVYDDIFRGHVAEFMKSPEALKLSDSFDNNLRLRAALDEAAIRSSREVQEMAAQDMLAMGSNITPDLNLVNFRKATPQQMASGYANTVPEFKQSVENAFEPILKDIHEAQTRIRRHLNPELSGLQKNLEQLVVYRGHHGMVTNNQPYPIGFTRFTEHTANIPMKTGEAAVPMEGRHFHELQSDLSKAMRAKGTKTGSSAKDQTEYDALEEKLSKMRADNTGGPTPEQYPVYQEFIKAHQGWVEDKMKQLAPMEKRLSILGTRLREKAPYSLEEPFAGFETNSRLRQQVLMKNAIQSAIRDGKQFATFPGQESNQSQLYVNKIEPNLKQIVKELGGKDSGFEVRRIELPNPKSNKTRDPKSQEMVPVWGIVWSPEAAARIMKTGVPFAKGGSVDKSNTDYRAYI
jgi:hypothetical protein